ncbi:MAG TPA: VIT domain-containing protein [Gemmatimonadaceae bacterium]|nr:VIT domain-containing protein [Gemmatimonadaceae bacterium]
MSRSIVRPDRRGPAWRTPRALPLTIALPLALVFAATLGGCRPPAPAASTQGAVVPSRDGSHSALRGARSECVWTCARVSGRVTDSSTGAPVPNAGVIVVGTRNGTLTDDDGRYQLRDVTPGTVVVRALRVGFAVRTDSVRVAKRDSATLDFALAPSALTLDVVPVTAADSAPGIVQDAALENAADGLPRARTFSDYLTYRTEDVPLRRAESSLDLESADELLVMESPSAPSSGVMLQGQVAAETKAARIRIRGANSLALSSEPLVIVDGTIAANRNIPPAEIADIQVLNPAQASAIYGSRGANGAIVIRTHKGAARDSAQRSTASGDTTRAPDCTLPADTTAYDTGLRARDACGRLLGTFPLQHTDVSAEISGYLARTVVEQRYTNPYTRPIEAVYVFPLGAMAAVSDFEMQIGERRIVGIVRPREEAERIYRQAVARGQTASLLSQERPNIFTQSVANIEPGGTVTVRITMFERLSYEDGRYSYVFPMVVGPRYVRGRPLVASGGDPRMDMATMHSASDVDREQQVTDDDPDSDRINPPVLAPGERSGHDISLSVMLDAGLPITELTSVAHRVRIDSLSPSVRRIRLAANDSIPNRDFVIRWSVAGAETQFGALAHRDSTGGYVTLTMQPPLAPTDAQVMPREITFIMDVSGSMYGLPLDLSKEVVEHSLDALRPDDWFNIVYFASGNAQLWEHARPRTQANVAEARRFLENVQGGGGTEMIAGVRRALAAHHDPSRLQMFVLLTDGFIGEDQELLGVVKNERGDARFFAFGIGSSVNRFLIDGVGAQGGGGSYVVVPRDAQATDRAARRLFAMIDSPVLVDVAIDWNGLPVTDVFPSRIHDLFAGQTINVIGRYDHEAHGTVYVTGRVGSRTVRYPVHVDLPAQEPAHAALAPTWARARIADLSARMLGASEDDQKGLRDEIVRLAVQHHLVSQYTSFVAVDESRVVGDGHPLRIMQPVELPEGVSYKGIFGEEPQGAPVRVGAWGITLQETESGAVRVGDVAGGSAAARAGLRPGAAVQRVNGTPVHTLAQMERVLLQSGRARVSMELDPGGVVELPMP